MNFNKKTIPEDRHAVTSLEKLKKEFNKFDLEDFLSKLQKADQIYVVFSCSDARVGGKTAYDLHGKNIFIDWVPNIGGNPPSLEEIEIIIAEYATHEIPENKLVFVANAHGTTAEITNNDNAIGCGARQAVHELNQGKISIDEFAKHHHIPIQTVHTACKLSTFFLNDRIEEIRNILQDNLNSLQSKIPVLASTFDHQKQELTILNNSESFTLKTHDKEWTHPVQQPVDIIVSIGSLVSIVPDEEYYAEVGEGPGMRFNAESALTSEFILHHQDKAKKLVLIAFAEAGYAIGQSIAEKGKSDKNFSNTKRFILAVDNEEILEFVLHVLHSDIKESKEIFSFIEKMKQVGILLFTTILQNKHNEKEVRILQI